MRTTKFAALFAAVALLVVGAAFASFAATGWVPEGDDWYYYDKEDVMADTCWRESNGGWYWLDESGVMAKESFVGYKGGIYYVNESGLMVTGWQKIYDEDDDADYWYYFQANGAAYKNAKKEVPTADGSHTYIFDANGRMLSGWVATTADSDAKYEEKEDDEYASATYYCGGADDGAVVLADWRYLNTADEDEEDSYVWFYFQASGKKACSTTADAYKYLTINGKRYAFDGEGKMVTEWAGATPSVTESVAYYNADGAQVTKGWFQAYKDLEDNVDEDEELNWYYALSKNKVAENRFVLDGGKLYLLDEEGKLVSGFAYVTFDTDDEGEEVKSNTTVDVIDDDITCEDGDWTGSELADTTRKLYYFNEVHDGTFGAMQTGTVKVTIDGDETEVKLATGTKVAKGAGIAVNRFDGSYYYNQGQALAGNEDYKYCAIKCHYTNNKDKAFGIKKLANEYVILDDQNLKTAGELNGYIKDPTTAVKDTTAYASEGYVVITSKGNFVKSLSKTDEDDYKWVVKNYILESVKAITE